MNNKKKIQPIFSMKRHLESLKVLVDTNPGKIRDSMPFVIFIFALAMGLFLFFDRYPLFHDEIINTYKASTGLIFDYALRPVFYFLNYLFYHFLGNSPISLTLAAVMYYALTASLLYSIGQRNFGLLGGFLSSFLFMFMPLVIHTGIRGMPNLPAGLMSVLIMYFLSRIFNTSSETLSSRYMLTIGCLNVIMFATHPTMMGVSAAILLWAGVGLAFNGRYFSIIYPDVLKRKHYALLLVSFFVTFVLLNLLFIFFQGHSYISLFLSGISKTNNPLYSGYFQPWYWYFTALIKNGNMINVVFLLIMVYFIFTLLVGRKKANKYSPSIGFVVIVLLTSLIFIITISLNKWKFDRVLVSFIPFYALSVGLVLSYVITWFIKNKNAIIYSLFGVLLIVSSGLWGVVSLYNYSMDLKKSVDISKERYYALYDQMCNLSTPVIGIVGDNNVQNFAMRYITIAGKIPVKLADSLQELNNNSDSDILIETLLADNVEYFLIPAGSKSLKDNVSHDYYNAFNSLVSLGATKLYSWRGLYEIWHFEIIPQSSDFYKYLMFVNPRARIGVYGTEKEVDEKYFMRFHYISDKFNLRLYPLVSNKRTGERNLYFINSNDISLVLLPQRETKGITEDKLNEMRLCLKNSNWKHLDTSTPLELELWIRNDN